MKRTICLVCMVFMLVCCSQKRFDKIEMTPAERYDIVYSGEKCAVYDNQADSLVTSLEYDSLHFMKSALEDSITIVIFGCSRNDKEGLLAVMEPNNETMEVLFPNSH